MRNRKELLAVGGMLAAFALLYSRVFVDLVRNWIRDDNYSHGFFVLPVVAYLVWQRRAQLAETERRPALIGLFIVAASLAILLTGTAGIEFFLMRTSAIGVAAGAVIFLAGWRWLRVLLFPLGFALFMIPLPAIIFYQIAFPLQLLATKFGVAVLELARIPVLREGNLIVLTSTTLEVAEACSGVRSLVSLTALAVLYGYFSDRRGSLRTVVALSAIPIAIIANGLRVAGTGVAAHYIGPAAATGFLHEFSGSVVFIASVVLLIGLTGLLKIALRAVRRPA